MGIPILPDVANIDFANSNSVSEPLVQSIQKKGMSSTAEIEGQQKEVLKRVREQNRLRQEDEMKVTMESLSSITKEAAVLAQEKGASAWLGTLPVEEHGFSLHKGDLKTNWH